ncbi:MAG: glutathione S-transferase family protein [Rhodobacteraceae bacterium]|nr:glutathione S-transferase family protein [Paracoccaceae bacterium]
MIDFYTNPRSRGAIVRWMLEETGAPYRTHLLDYGAAMKSAAYRAINPMGKVPAIVHEGRVVTECAAICAYLADAFPEAGLAPPLAERGAYYRWLFFAAGPLEAVVSNRAMGFEVPADRERTIGYGNFGSVMDALEHAVSSTAFVAGDRFSAADVYLGSLIGWGYEFGPMEPRPALRHYVDRIRDREAYRRARAIDDAAAPSA